MVCENINILFYVKTTGKILSPSPITGKKNYIHHNKSHTKTIFMQTFQVLIPVIKTEVKNIATGLERWLGD